MIENSEISTVSLIKKLWSLDTSASLRNLLEFDYAKNGFMEFLKTEFSEEMLRFYLDVVELENLKAQSRAKEAIRIYKFLLQATKKITKPKETPSLMIFRPETTTRSENDNDIDPQFALKKLREEADITFNMLATHAFPRFLESSFCYEVIEKLGKDNLKSFRFPNFFLNETNFSDAEEWLQKFSSHIELFPAGISITDMTLPGVPLVYVNENFCTSTGYSREEAIGRNCRFLQGPKTEPEAIYVIRSALSRAENCRVIVTNYRKSGEIFKNLLSLKPVFDGNEIYRFVIGVVFDVSADARLELRLMQLDKMLSSIPQKLSVPSKIAKKGQRKRRFGNRTASSAGTLHNDTTDSNFWHIFNKTSEYRMANINNKNVIYGFTKVLWLNNPMLTIQNILQDSFGRDVFMSFCDITSIAYRAHFEFCCHYSDLCATKDTDRIPLLSSMMSSSNPFLYDLETLDNDSNSNNSKNSNRNHDHDTLYWEKILTRMASQMNSSLPFLAGDPLRHFMESKLSHLLIMRLSNRECDGDVNKKLTTVACGIDIHSATSWMDMFRVVADSMSIGMLVSDMSEIGLPLAYINEGFRNMSGYGKDKIGDNCRFLQGPETQDYLIDEIKTAIQQSEPLLVKLHNYKADGQKFQCLLGLHPVFGRQFLYKYQIGFQVEFGMHINITTQLLEMERALRYLPHSIVGEDPDYMKPVIPFTMTGDSSLHPLVSELQLESLGDLVTTCRGINKDHYGRKLCKRAKVKEIKTSFSNRMKLYTSCMKKMIEVKTFQEFFLEALPDDRSVQYLQFYINYLALQNLDVILQGIEYKKLYISFMSSQIHKIILAETTDSTQLIFNLLRHETFDEIDTTSATVVMKELADLIITMIAIHYLPKLITTDQFKDFLDIISSKNDPNVRYIIAIVEDILKEIPVEVNEWLQIVASMINNLSDSMSIADVSVAGCPLIFINKEFVKLTGYKKDEITGRNCRFLQGPDTEPDAIETIRSAIRKGKGCIVKILNYKKNGDMYSSMLMQRPFFDSNYSFRFVIGTQMDTSLSSTTLAQKVVKMDCLLNFIPSVLPFCSKRHSQKKVLATVPPSSGSSHEITSTKSEKEGVDAMTGCPETGSLTSSEHDNMTILIDYRHTLCAFTRIMWLQDPVKACRGVLLDDECRAYFANFAETNCSVLVKAHILFFDWAMKIHNASGPDQAMVMRGFHMEYQQNPLFYCTTNEIPVGQLDNTDWQELYNNMSVWQEQTAFMLAKDAFRRFLEDAGSTEMILSLHRREAAGEPLRLKTAGYGCDIQASLSDNTWIELFSIMSDALTVGMVVSDMSVPGTPLAYINSSFYNITGYGKEKIGSNCRFLQGPETQDYLIDEIRTAIQQSEPLLVKLHNYKADGQKFQCLLALHPVFGPAPEHEYKYMIGMQLDFNDQDPDLQSKMAEFGRVLRYLPQTVNGSLSSSSETKLGILQQLVQDVEEETNRIAAVAASQPTIPYPTHTTLSNEENLKASMIANGLAAIPATNDLTSTVLYDIITEVMDVSTSGGGDKKSKSKSTNESRKSKQEKRQQATTTTTATGKNEEIPSTSLSSSNLVTRTTTTTTTAGTLRSGYSSKASDLNTLGISDHGGVVSVQDITEQYQQMIFDEGGEEYDADRNINSINFNVNDTIMTTIANNTTTTTTTTTPFRTKPKSARGQGQGQNGRGVDSIKDTADITPMSSSSSNHGPSASAGNSNEIDGAVGSETTDRPRKGSSLTRPSSPTTFTTTAMENKYIARRSSQDSPHIEISKLNFPPLSEAILANSQSKKTASSHTKRHDIHRAVSAAVKSIVDEQFNQDASALIAAVENLSATLHGENAAAASALLQSDYKVPRAPTTSNPKRSNHSRRGSKIESSASALRNVSSAKKIG